MKWYKTFEDMLDHVPDDSCSTRECIDYCLEDIEAQTEEANRRFQDALKRGDDFEMDFYHAATVLLEERRQKARAMLEMIGACGAYAGLLNCIGFDDKLIFEKENRKVRDTRGFSAITDAVLDVLEEHGFV